MKKLQKWSWFYSINFLVSNSLSIWLYHHWGFQKKSNISTVMFSLFSISGNHTDTKSMFRMRLVRVRGQISTQVLRINVYFYNFALSFQKRTRMCLNLIPKVSKLVSHLKNMRTSDVTWLGCRKTTTRTQKEPRDH